MKIHIVKNGKLFKNYKLGAFIKWDVLFLTELDCICCAIEALHMDV